MFRFLAKNNYLGIPLLRVGVAVVFIYHGYHKLFGLGPVKTAQYFDSVGIPLSSIAAYVSGSAELFGGVMVGIGLLTRQASLFLIIDMLVAIFVAHRADVYPAQEHAIQMAILSLATLFSGSGRWSLENVVRKHGD